MNRFELRLKVVETPETGDPALYPAAPRLRLDTEIWVDGRHLDEPHPIDLPLLVKSLHVAGDYDIFTCSCGESGCAGIVEGVHVAHDGEDVMWRFRRPQSAGDLWRDSSISAWEASAVPVSFAFDRKQMLDAFRTYLDAVRRTVGRRPTDFHWPVHEVYVADVLDMNPDGP